MILLMTTKNDQLKGNPEMNIRTDKCQLALRKEIQNLIRHCQNLERRNGELEERIKRLEAKCKEVNND